MNYFVHFVRDVFTNSSGRPALFTTNEKKNILSGFGNISFLSKSDRERGCL
jgi:hypothetical protein